MTNTAPFALLNQAHADQLAATVDALCDGLEAVSTGPARPLERTPIPLSALRVESRDVAPRTRDACVLRVSDNAAAKAASRAVYDHSVRQAASDERFARRGLS